MCPPASSMRAVCICSGLGSAGGADRVDGRATSEVVFSEGAGLASGFVFSMPMPDDAPRAHLVVCDVADEQMKPWETGEVNSHGRPVLRDPTPEEIASILRSRGWGTNELKIIPLSVRWCTGFTINSRLSQHFQSGHAASSNLATPPLPAVYVAP